MSDEKTMGQVIQIDEARIRDHLGKMVRGTVEETLNAMLEAEADQLCGAGRYERSQARQDTRAGSYERSLQTSAGEVNLKVPKLPRQTFEAAIIQRYRRRESSVEEALIEMYLAGISMRQVEDITEGHWGTRVSPSKGTCSVDTVVPNAGLERTVVCRPTSTGSCNSGCTMTTSARSAAPVFCNLRLAQNWTMRSRCRSS